MRLMQMGYKVHVVGDTVTPAIGARDLLIIGSGSGETQSLVSMAQKAKGIGSAVAVVTVNLESRIGKLSDAIVRLPGTTKEQNQGSLVTVQPMASLFEQTMLIVLDAVILRLMEMKELHSENMFGRTPIWNKKSRCGYSCRFDDITATVVYCREEGVMHYGK